MMLFLCLLLPAVYGLSSSKFYEYQLDHLVPKWIKIRNEGGPYNVTVDYDKCCANVFEVDCFWWVNGRLITDGDYNFRVINFRRYRRMLMNVGYQIFNENTRRASILIPQQFDVRSLQLQLVSGVLDIVLDINVIPLAPHKAIQEIIPKYNVELEPKDEIVYDRGDKLEFYVHFGAKNLKSETFDGVKAEFIGMDQCTTPSLLNFRSSDRNADLLTIWTPTWDNDSEDLDFNQLINLRLPGHETRRLNVTYSSTDNLPRGILKVTTGYRSRSSCRLFAGVKVTRSVFLKPPPHDERVYFLDDSVAFIETRGNYDVNYGGDVDVTLRAIGGKLIQYESFRREMVVGHPDIFLFKHRRNITATAEVKQVLQNRVVFRFRNVTVSDSGRYLAVAKFGRGRAKMNFNIYVKNASPLYSQ